MCEDRSLFLSDKTKLKWIPKNYKDYLNKTTILYGLTGSGKSTIIEEIMYLCKDFIPNVGVIAPTNTSNDNYTGKVPTYLIRKNMDVKWLDKILLRQKEVSTLFKNANKINILKSLFDKVSDETARVTESSAIKKSHSYLITVDQSSMAFKDKKKQKNQILTERDDMLKKIYKTSIRFNKVSLEGNSSLTNAELACVKFLDFNPNIMIILDDCASKFKKICKQSSTMKEIFYEGRHYYITTIISTQDDKEIEPELRKNSRVSIFTSAQSATCNFEKTSNGYPKNQKLRAKIATEAVFEQDENDIKHFQKLVYVQGEADPFRYTIADIYDDFKMGDRALWKLDDAINKKRSKEARNNPVFDKYL
jgi:energy-coupling factor transporter ATP-binding protein EcfA2